MMRKDIRIIWRGGDNYAIDGVEKDLQGKPYIYFGNKIGAVLYLTKALFQLLTTNKYPSINIIVIGHEPTKEGGEQ